MKHQLPKTENKAPDPSAQTFQLSDYFAWLNSCSEVLSSACACYLDSFTLFVLRQWLFCTVVYTDDEPGFEIKQELTSEMRLLI